MLVGIVLVIASAIVAGAILVAHGAHTRATHGESRLTDSPWTATTGYPFSDRSLGGRPGGKGAPVMAVIVDDLRAGVSDAWRYERRPITGFITGWAMIILAAVFGDGPRYDTHSVTLMAGGIALVVGSILVPYLTERARPKLDAQVVSIEDLAKVESAVLERFAIADQEFAELVREMQQMVAGIRGQLR